MLYLIVQYLLLLVIAVGLGLAVGWLLWGRMVAFLANSNDVESTKFHTRAADLGNELKFKGAEVGRLQSDLAQALADEAALRSELEEIRTAHDEIATQLDVRERDLAEMRDALVAAGRSEEQLQRVLGECRAAQRQAETENNRLRAMLSAGPALAGGSA